MNLTPEVLTDLRRKTDEASARNRHPGDEGVHVVEVDPGDMSTLLDQIEEFERNAEVLRENDKAALEQLAHALGWKDGGPGWQAALDAIVEMRARIEALSVP